MGSLVYTAFCSLDGYIEDSTGSFMWARPDEEVLTFVNDLERTAKTHLLGRRMYETMQYWDTPTDDFDASDLEFAARWQATNKIVYSTTLKEAPSPNTRIERTFDAREVNRLKESVGGDLSIGGAALAGAGFRAGVVDALNLVMVPIVIGSGKPVLTRDLVIELRLRDERGFSAGAVSLSYDVQSVANLAP